MVLQTSAYRIPMSSALPFGLNIHLKGFLSSRNQDFGRTITAINKNEREKPYITSSSSSIRPLPEESSFFGGGGAWPEGEASSFLCASGFSPITSIFPNRPVDT